jgi:hypothetical protein
MINVSPKGRDVGFRRKEKKEPKEFDAMTKAAIKIAQISSQMEDSTESAISQMEMLRQQTKRKAQL